MAWQVRTPSRREARFLGNVEFAEVHRSEYIQQAMMFLPKLSEREQRTIAEHIKVLAETPCVLLVSVPMAMQLASDLQRATEQS